MPKEKKRKYPAGKKMMMILAEVPTYTYMIDFSDHGSSITEHVTVTYAALF